MKPFNLTFELKIVELEQTILTQYEITESEIATIEKEMTNPLNDDGITIAEVLASTIAEEVNADLHTQLEGVLLHSIH